MTPAVHRSTPEASDLSHRILSQFGAGLPSCLPMDTVPESLVIEAGRDGTPCARFLRRGHPELVVIQPTRAGGAWHPVSPATDPDLPGGFLLSDSPRLAEACGFDRIEWVKVRAYRPGRRAVLEVRGEELGRPRTRFLKLFRTRTFRHVSEVYAVLDRTGEGRRFVQPTAIHAEEACLVFPGLSGRSLHERLKRGDGGATDGVGLWLGLASRSVAGGDLPERGLEDERSSTLTMLWRGSPCVPGLLALIDHVAALSLPSVEGHSVLHGDLHDKQLFATAAGWRAIDADGAARGPAFIDGVNLAIHLELRGRQGGAPPSAGLAPGVAAPHVLPDTVRRYRALVLARLAAVYSLRPHWSFLSLDLVRDATKLLEVLR